jgi:curved DNA-binding protein CbpA
MSSPPGGDPFAALGLPARPGLTDDEVRSAWRRIATATHPDRADGGDPSRFALAAAAYTVLRTRSGRGEALADLVSPSPGSRWPRAARARFPDTSRDTGPPRTDPDSAASPPGAALPGAALRPGPASPAAPPGATPREAPARPGRASPMATSPGVPLRAVASGTRRPEWMGRLSRVRLLSRIRRGRPARLALRFLIAAAVAAIAVAAVGAQPATPALITGAVTWLLLTGRHDLA